MSENLAREEKLKLKKLKVALEILQIAINNLTTENELETGVIH